LQWRSRLKISFCEIFGAVQFSTFATLPARSGHSPNGADAELVGKAVILSDGRAGTAENVSLDEDHGLQIPSGAIPGAGRFDDQVRAKVSLSGG
jgi:hypothetical protein